MCGADAESCSSWITMSSAVILFNKDLLDKKQNKFRKSSSHIFSPFVFTWFN